MTVVSPLFRLISMLFLWFVLAYGVSWHEAIAGGAAAVIAMIPAYILERTTEFRFTARKLAQIVHVPRQIAGDLTIMVRYLFRLPGNLGMAQQQFATYPFETGADDPHSRGSRLIAVAYGTMSPNSVVIDADPEKNYLLLHQIQPQPEPGMFRELEQK